MQLKDPSLFRQQAYVNGVWSDADNGENFGVSNPATGAHLGTVPNMGAAETRRAIEAANAAWPAWRKKTAKERATVLRKWFDLMLENADDLALLMTAEQGKPLAESKGEVAFGASFIEWFAEEGKRVAGDTLAVAVAGPPHDRDQGADRRLRRHHPLELPAAMITRKAGPALAAGCPMVLKPAEADAVFGAGAGRAGRARRRAAGRVQCRYGVRRKKSAPRCAPTLSCAS
jgi:succinate-semialdehyde dehydrogenase/glutarate-semialdehyde dehydrogenase